MNDEDTMNGIPAEMSLIIKLFELRNMIERGLAWMRAQVVAERANFPQSAPSYF
jgi:hypothetical protein